MVIVNPRVKDTVSPEQLADLKKIPPATIGHVLDYEFMDYGLRPLTTNFTFVGPATTVRCHGHDSSIVHYAVDAAEPGDVIVVDRMGDMRYACWGGGVALGAHVKGIAGAVVDGVLTDRVEIVEMGFNIFGRGLSPVTTRGGGVTGDLNVPVKCGGVIVNPGDIILADDDGILVLAPERVAQIIEDFMPRVLREPEMHRAMREDGIKLSERSGAKRKIEEQLRRQAEQG
jgi:regulator of RNase E activity RraA